MIHTLVIFGATGDLTGRYLMPALARVLDMGRLPQPFRILGLSYQDWTEEQFREHTAEQLERYSDADEDVRARLLRSLAYRCADVADRQAVIAAVRDCEGPVAAYLALPSALFAPAIEALSQALPSGSRVVVEKPFGDSLESARALNRLLHRSFPEDAVFRIDHFLGMQPVQHVLGLRFANRLFEPLWHRDHVDRVEVVWDETLALEGRASYYDRAGALRDMIQNHLLQLLCMVAMEPPASLDEHDQRDRKVEVLRAVRRLSADEAARRTVRARYGPGRIGGRAVPAYTEEPGVDPARATETFAEVVLSLDNRRWAGVPFFLRSGKALGRDRREVVLHFKPSSYPTFDRNGPVEPNRLHLPLDTDRLVLHLNLNETNAPCDVRPIVLDTDLAPQQIPAYGRLLLDVLAGDHSHSVRDDEAEESWRIVEPILSAWEEGRSPLHEYPAGSAGPSVSAAPDERDRLSAA
ncbi:glucose-6-phosphate dehydrogenase [Nitrospira moscoviensis]|uniref:Glucose-6-phosphate 1-dehydrogenase n=1 Tax=Nitrospira moscoviensis TaxID=42253 RepID=A0A0K2GE91_NITMO|nr:glucose-6-phosphate dehydrogenase [Nitrospira moscoviensis]ALA59184.1 Glucose-6-phosphate 1-dehydrogenase [Nitrospira moscoviensis]